MRAVVVSIFLYCILGGNAFSNHEGFMNDQISNFYQLNINDCGDVLLRTREALQTKFPKGTDFSALMEFHLCRSRELNKNIQFEIIDGVLVVYFFQVTEKVKRDFRVMFEIGENFKLKDSNILFDSVAR